MYEVSEVSDGRKRRFARTELLFGEEGMRYLASRRVAVFGLGGVGGHAAEAVVRSGIGSIDLVDGDIVDRSNLNRQIIALESTVGQPKVEAAASRFLDINPDLAVFRHNLFFSGETAESFDFSQYDYIIDAIDDIPAKVLMIRRAYEAGVPIVSSMGTGNKLDPLKLEVADIFETSVCPLAKTVRKALRKEGVPHLKVVYSREEPKKMQTGRGNVGSVSFVPAAAGLILAGEVIRDLLRKNFFVQMPEK